jgi:hypothetical protein
MAARWPAPARPRSSRGAAVRAIRFRKTWSTRHTDRDRVDLQPIECPLDRWLGACARPTWQISMDAAVGRREACGARGCRPNCARNEIQPARPGAAGLIRAARWGVADGNR